MTSHSPQVDDTRFDLAYRPVPSVRMARYCW